ncbi:agmatine deiminase family protein [Halioxenophilus sp. WMMB6]|uniref:agmatine deiminase family protein n=1 Tax=Halioxenophilus sp. WMMB6 TaxID=3073815 RepID=UPI00295EB1A6|nr:agmatine deiminase family protein [Halioxenophilus sp. WMMB6]
MSNQTVMPAEWTPHERCWMAWPCNESLWRGNIEGARINYAAVANAIAHFEPVTMLTPTHLLEDARRRLCPQVSVVAWELDDSWMRDIGPTFVQNVESGAIMGIDWRFNGWGKFPHEQDQWVAEKLLTHLGIPRLASPLINEGGAIHVDGAGTCLATQNVQLNSNRNGQLPQSTVESYLKEALGVNQVIWFERGLYDDHTDGHVDQFACFTAPGKIVALTCSDSKDPNYEILQSNIELLKNSRDSQGRAFEITTIEQPPSAYFHGERLGKSYINFYIANGGVVVPSYGLSDYDSEAYRVLQSAFPNRQVVQVDSQVLVTGGGNIHCITQQQPLPGNNSR